MRRRRTITTHSRRLAVLVTLVLALLLGSCHAGDDDSGPSESRCVIQALETIAANSPEKSVEIETIFTSPQRLSDVSHLLKGSDLQPTELRMLKGDNSMIMGGGFESIELAFDAAQEIEAAPSMSCWSENSAADRLSQTGDENNCELRIEGLKLRGPANAALAFRAKAGSVATTSRVPSNDELIEFMKAQLRQADDASTEVRDCTQGKWQPH